MTTERGRRRGALIALCAAVLTMGASGVAVAQQPLASPPPAAARTVVETALYTQSAERVTATTPVGATESFRVQIAAKVPLTLSGASWTGSTGPDYSITGSASCPQSNSGSASLEPGEICVITVSSHPQRLMSVIESVRFLAQERGDGNVPVGDPLAGSFVVDIVSRALVFSERMDFGRVEVGQSLTIPLEMTNISQVGVLLRFSLDDAPFELVGAESGEEIRVGPGATSRILVRFAPQTEGEALSSGVLRYRLDDGSPAQRTDYIPLTGTGIPLPVAPDVTATSIDFGTVPLGERVERSFTVTNRSDGEVRLDELDDADARAAGITLTSPLAGEVLPPGQSLTVGAAWEPTATGPMATDVRFSAWTLLPARAADAALEEEGRPTVRSTMTGVVPVKPTPTPDPTGEPTPTPTPDPTGEPTPDPTVTPTPDPTGEPTPTAQPTDGATETPAPGATTDKPGSGLAQTGAGGTGGILALAAALVLLGTALVAGMVRRARAA